VPVKEARSKIAGSFPDCLSFCRRNLRYALIFVSIRCAKGPKSEKGTSRSFVTFCSKV
jgi:hypothetical protein